MKTIFALIFAVQAICLQANGFRLERDVAQYKGSDYANVVRVERGISLEKALEIAEADPEIDYFFYLKGEQMVLEIPPDAAFDPASDPSGLVSEVDFLYDSGEPGRGYCRVFRHGDTVFFKKEGLWLGSAPGLADVYFKEANLYQALSSCVILPEPIKSEERVFTPEDVLPDGDDHTIAVNPFTGFQGRARKGTVAATLNNIALLDRLFLENANQDQVVSITKAIVELIPSLKAVGIFDLFDPKEWINNPKHLGRTYVALLYLKHYPNEISEEIIHKLQEIKKIVQNPFFQSELQALVMTRKELHNY